MNMIDRHERSLYGSSIEDHTDHPLKISVAGISSSASVNRLDRILSHSESMGHSNGFRRCILSSISINLTRKFTWAMLVLLATLPTTANGELDADLYEKHCQEFVPASTGVKDQKNSYSKAARLLGFHQASYEGGESIFKSDGLRSNPPAKSASFVVHRLEKTELDGVFKMAGSLTIRSRRYALPIDRGFGRATPFRNALQPRLRPRAGVLTVAGEGFWSNSSHRLCMVGSAQRYFSNGTSSDYLISVRFAYPEIGTIVNNMITGTVERLDSEKQFESISITAIYDGVYKFTRVEDAERLCSLGIPDVLDASIDVLKKSDVSVCNFHWLSKPMELVWNPECSGRDCSPFNVSNRGLLPSSMFFQNFRCDLQGRVHGFLGFSRTWRSAMKLMLPDTFLMGEGKWSADKGQLCLVACLLGDDGRVLKSLSEEDCGIRISVQFPLTQTVLNRYIVVGHVGSGKKEGDAGYFKNFTFRGPAGIGQGMKAMRDLPNLQYRYTTLDRVRQVCNREKNASKQSSANNAGRRYPDGSTFGDLRFDASIVNADKQMTWGYVSPLTIGNSFDRPLQFLPGNTTVAVHSNEQSNGEVNVSYNLQFGLSEEFQWEGAPHANVSLGSMSHIAAEGIYDSRTGSLCMVGCHFVGSQGADLDGDMDCNILIEVQYAPSNPELFGTEHASGKITSLRKEKDPHHFRPITLSSAIVYLQQARKTIWRKDLEIIMRLISLSLAAIFIGIQLLYVRRHSNALPFISLLMLTVLTLGLMIPLVLNFEAFFMNQNRQNILQWSGGWLEVNEVIVRVMTMIAFLLQLRLLQLAWSARLAAASEKSAWLWERKVFYVCLPLYLVGGLIACFVHYSETSHPKNIRFLERNSQHALWEDFRSYAGLILDGFLLPQVLGNVFWDIKEKALVPYFYVGITLVRSLPHGYDAYRAMAFIPQYSGSYFYANPDWDFYSTAWDIVIPCGALLLALLVFLQQRFGGRCIVPQRFRDRIEYQKIPGVDR